MTYTAWLRVWTSFRFGSRPSSLSRVARGRATQARRHQRRSLLRVERLEDRLVPANGLPVINEIQTGGATANDFDNEFVEIYNPTATDFNLTGWTVEYRAAAAINSNTLITLPSGMFLAGGGFLTLGHADPNGHTGYHDLTYSGVALGAAGGGLALVQPFGAIVDSVGWGTATNSFVEGTVAPAPPAGQSIARNSIGTDTNNNNSDFTIRTTPTPGQPTGNSAPVIADQTFAIAENSPRDSVVGTVAASDPDTGQSLTYAIVFGNTGGSFAFTAIAGVSGQLTVANSTALDFETTPTFLLTVQVTDNATPALSSTARITVNLTDVSESGNKPPVIADQTFAVAENSPRDTVLGTVVASDPDAGQTLTYAITSGNTGGAFGINASTGRIKVNNDLALDFETTPTFVLIVQVTDNGTPPGSSTAKITINLTDVNEGGNQSPVIADQTFAVAENSPRDTVVGTVAASDPDPGQSLTYTITAGNTGGAFAFTSLAGVAGQLTVANSTALDFETTPTFLLTVQVTDNGAPALSRTATITVNLTDVNEVENHQPVIADQTFAITGDSRRDTVVGTVVASDPDTGQTLTYAITAGDRDGAFAINTATGRITVANIDALKSVVTPFFSLTVRVTDNAATSLSSTATVTINLSKIVGIVDDPCGTGTALVVVGTAGPDVIRFTVTPGGVAVTLNKVGQGVFSPTSRIIAYGLDGNDVITVTKLSLASWLYGGIGNDKLAGANGNDVLLGGDNNDKLSGGAGRDLLIGGRGADGRKAGALFIPGLLGGAGEDILIAGFTDYDEAPIANQMALCDLMTNWTSASALYSARVATLTGGVDPSRARLDTTTVHDDATNLDVLRGDSNLDWYFANTVVPGTKKDKVIGKVVTGEMVSDISP